MIRGGLPRVIRALAGGVRTTDPARDTSATLLGRDQQPSLFESVRVKRSEGADAS
jgi:hypothetical protein